MVSGLHTLPGLVWRWLCMQVAFILPTAYPVDFANFNYAPISVVVAIAIICLAWYFPRYGARDAFLEGTRSLQISASGKASDPQLLGSWLTAAVHERMLLHVP